MPVAELVVGLTAGDFAHAKVEPSVRMCQSWESSQSRLQCCSFELAAGHKTALKNHRAAGEGLRIEAVLSSKKVLSQRRCNTGPQQAKLAQSDCRCTGDSERKAGAYKQ